MQRHPRSKSSRQLDHEIAASLARGRHKYTAPPSTAAHASKRAQTKLDPKAITFFRKHAGTAKRPNESWATARQRGAKDLARAEAEAEARGWKVQWDHDPEPYDLGDGEEEPAEVLVAVLYDENGTMLESLGSIGMSGKTTQDRNYGRVVAAELALEALSKH